MKKGKGSYRGLGVLGAALAVLLAVSLACGADDTATPAAAPAPAATLAPVPTAAPGATAVPAPTTAPVADVGPRYGGNLRLARNVEAYTMDPTFSYEYSSLWAMYSVFNSLVILDNQAQIQPDLAESWEFSPDGKTITFNIRPGVMFSDGTPADANAVKLTYDRYLDRDVGRSGVINRRATQLGQVESY